MGDAAKAAGLSAFELERLLREKPELAPRRGAAPGRPRLFNEKEVAALLAAGTSDKVLAAIGRLGYADFKSFVAVESFDGDRARTLVEMAELLGVRRSVFISYHA